MACPCQVPRGFISVLVLIPVPLSGNVLNNKVHICVVYNTTISFVHRPCHNYIFGRLEHFCHGSVDIQLHIVIVTSTNKTMRTSIISAYLALPNILEEYSFSGFQYLSRFAGLVIELVPFLGLISSNWHLTCATSTFRASRVLRILS